MSYSVATKSGLWCSRPTNNKRTAWGVDMFRRKIEYALVSVIAIAITPMALADWTAGTSATVTNVTHNAATFSASITTDSTGSGEYVLYFSLFRVGGNGVAVANNPIDRTAVNGNKTTTFTASVSNLSCGADYDVSGTYLPSEGGTPKGVSSSPRTRFSTLPCATLTPSTLSLKYFAGNAITPVTLTSANFNGTATFQITPSLPAGLLFDTATGAISGTPTVAKTDTGHTITATGAVSGSATVTLNLTVAPPLTDLEVLRYIASQPDLIDAFGTNIANGRQHYLNWGFNEGRKITFEPLSYTASHPDLIAAFGIDETKAATHYIQWGLKEKRQVTFSALRYIASHPDLIEAFGADADKGVRHYINWGFKEGRKVTFDPLRYTASHPDLISAFAGDETKTTTHYIQAGYREKRQSTFSDLDALQYIASYADLITSLGSDVVAGIKNYVEKGYQAGRRILFDALTYIASHSDLIAAFGADAVAGVKHYINWGYKEGRKVVFDSLGYLAAHSDLRAAFGSDTAAATRHYINWGFKEGRGYLWTVSATAGAGGQVSASRTYVKTGEKASISVTPQSGYKIVSVTGCGGSLSGTTYTTAPVSGTCSIKADFTFVNVTLAVLAKYQRPALAVSSGAAPGWETPIVSSIPNVWIELQDATGQVVAGGYADATGQRTFTGLSASTTYTPVLRSKALTTAGFDVWVVDNTLPLGAGFSTPRTRYAPHTARFSPITPAPTESVQGFVVTASIGWDSAKKILDDSARVSGPFAIIADVIRQQIAAADAGAINANNKLTILWSPKNKGGLAEGEPENYDAGLVSGSGAFASSCAANIKSTGVADGCSSFENIPHIWLSGSQTFEPMEFTTQITVHEMTHFTQRQSQRSYSPGGPHSYNEHQDLTLAHHEGFATGAATVLLQSPKLERWYVSQGTIKADITDYSVAIPQSPVGWFQESTFTRFIWKLFDPSGAIRLTPRDIYAPYYSTTWKNGLFVPSAWAYGNVLKTLQPAKAGSIDQLGADLKITLAGNDIWGSTEQVLGSRTSKQTFPVIPTIPTSGTVEVCTAGKPYEYNKMSNRRYLRVLGDGSPRKYTVAGPTSTVPYMFIVTTTGNAGFSIFSKGTASASRTLTVPSTGAWARLGECKVSRYTNKVDEGTNCSESDYTPPEEQCWTITVEQGS